ncbi:MAG: hypothetical protein LBE14_03335, partial [Treponema sp.]|nr:hypothetical protein [Treponema sp.]
MQFCFNQAEKKVKKMEKIGGQTLPVNLCYQWKRIQEFKVSPIGFISPDEKDKSGPVFMEKTTEDVPQRTKEIV